MAKLLGTDDGAGFGVEGQSSKGVGVWGRAQVAALTPSGGGVVSVGSLGELNAAGILNATPGGQTTVIPRAGVIGQSDTSPGVYGTSVSFDAVVGESYSDVHAGVTGRNSAKVGTGESCGIYGVGGKYAGKFDGDLQVNGNGHVTGQLTVDIDIILSASDCAEEFDLQAAGGVEPGTVMVLDEMGTLEPSRQVYDKKVAGVVSGAGDYRPGMILNRRDTAHKRAPVALMGKVFCKVDAQYAPVEVGDLLTTSPTPGHAMKATDPMRAFGAVIGKALRRLPEGCGLVPVLVALQ